MSYTKNIIRVFSANFLTMISGIIIGFLLPVVLSIESYAYIKTYTFYVSYLGLLHLGFIDGMYIKYGGKNILDINPADIKLEHRIFTIIQLIATTIFIILGIVSSNIIIIILAISIIPINTISFHKIFYQAIGCFKEYSKILYIYTILYLIFNILLVIKGSDNYIYYCLVSLFVNIYIYIGLEVKFYKKVKNIDIDKKNINIAFSNIKIGFFVLLGNFSVLLFYAIDRWFIKIFFSVDDFAYYSFAVSMLNIVNILMNSVAMTFYNYLAKGEKQEKIKQIKEILLIIGVVSSGVYFILSGIVSIFIGKYQLSLNIIAISFVAYPYMMIVNCLYINLYKSRKIEKKYFKIVLSMLTIAIIINFLAILIYDKPEAIAMATTLSFIIWYIYSIKDFKYLKITVKEGIYLVVMGTGFMLLASQCSWFWGGILYLGLIIIMTSTIYRKRIIQILKKFNLNI